MRYAAAGAAIIGIALGGWGLSVLADPVTSDEVRVSGDELQHLPNLEFGDAESERLGASFPLGSDSLAKLWSWFACAKVAKHSLDRPDTMTMPLDDAPYSVTSNGGASYEVETYVEAEDRLGRRHRLPFVCRVSDPLGDHGPSLTLRWK